MSLAVAVSVVAEEMTKAFKEGPEVIPSTTLEFYAAQLRIAVKAAEREATSIQGNAQTFDPEVFHRQQIEKARSEFRTTKEDGLQHVRKDDSTAKDLIKAEAAPCAYEVFDGPLKGDSVALPGDMPVGARTNLSGNVYQLGEDRKLRWQKPEIRV